MRWFASVTTSSEAGAQYRHFDAMPLGLGVIREGRLVYANTSLLKMLAGTAEELVGRSVPELLQRFPESEALLDRYALKPPRTHPFANAPVEPRRSSRRAEGSARPGVNARRP